MAVGNLSELVRDGTPDEEVHLIPVIEKEILHYDVLDSLERLSLLEQMVFHGGTCLRLCYGAKRRSEDLDFAFEGDLDTLGLERLEAEVCSSLMSKFGLTATVRPPKKTVEFANARMQRWWMVVDTAPERPDLPSQRLKIEIVSVETLTREVRRIAKNYDYLAPSAGNTLAVCETREEILADKLVSFVNTPPTYVRKRDVWDMMFLLSQAGMNLDSVPAMARRKMEIYGCPLVGDSFVDEGISRTMSVAGSKDFDRDMQRFMPKAAFAELLGSPMKRQFSIDEVCNLYRSI